MHTGVTTLIVDKELLHREDLGVAACEATLASAAGLHLPSGAKPGTPTRTLCIKRQACSENSGRVPITASHSRSRTPPSLFTLACLEKANPESMRHSTPSSAHRSISSALSHTQPVVDANQKRLGASERLGALVVPLEPEGRVQADLIRRAHFQGALAPEVQILGDLCQD